MAEQHDRKTEIDEEEAIREHRAVMLRDYLTEAFPDRRLAPEWWDETHGGEQCFRLDGESDYLEVRVTRPLMMGKDHTVEEIERRLGEWDPEACRHVRVSEKGLSVQ